MQKCICLCAYLQIRASLPETNSSPLKNDGIPAFHDHFHCNHYLSDLGPLGFFSSLMQTGFFSVKNCQVGIFVASK